MGKGAGFKLDRSTTQPPPFLLKPLPTRQVPQRMCDIVQCPGVHWGLGTESPCVDEWECIRAYTISINRVSDEGHTYNPKLSWFTVEADVSCKPCLSLVRCRYIVSPDILALSVGQRVPSVPQKSRFIRFWKCLGAEEIRKRSLWKQSLSKGVMNVYDAAPIQSSVVLCSCPFPSMVRSQADSSSPPVVAVATCGHRPGLNMESTAVEPRATRVSLQQPSQPWKKRPEDFKFGKILGEGSFSTVPIL
ncbi:UNVERIFIED_CONTAM: hypothetical protein K2H54_049709 [Gekko kuhli]